MTKPFIKCPGGKTTLLPELLSRIPSSFNRYYEPFLGGGALFWALLPYINGAHGAWLNDSNEDIWAAWVSVRDKPDELLKELAKYEYSSVFYYFMRDKIDPDRLDIIGRAARFIYLNKCCFNGLIRYNSKGKFNAPIGAHKNPKFHDPDLIMNCHNALKQFSINISNIDFTLLSQINIPTADDFVYFDPPYMPISATSSFTGYTSNGFNFKDQEILANNFKDLANRAIKVMLSNSNHPEIHKLYASYHIEIVHAPRMINCKSSGRKPIGELIIRNY